MFSLRSHCHEKAGNQRRRRIVELLVSVLFDENNQGIVALTAE